MVRHQPQKMSMYARAQKSAWVPTQRMARPAPPKDPRLQGTDTILGASHHFRPRKLREPEEDVHAFDRDLFRELDALGRADREGRRMRRCDSDESMDWDDESTLVAMLQDASPEDDEDEFLLALVNKLKAPMSAQSVSLKQYLADTLLPVITRMKEAHETMEDHVDLAFGTGILAFDEVCKKLEAIALRDEDELKTAYMDSQTKIQVLLAQLQTAYTRRDELFSTVSIELDARAAGATSALESLSAQLDHTVSQLEKKSKELDKESSAASKQKMLRGILEKLA